MDWSQLPYDVLVVIANKLNDVADFVSFSAVCCYWRSVYQNREWNHPQRTPWLMLNKHGHGALVKRRFFSFSSFKYYYCYSPYLEAPNCRYWGSSHGWIVSFSKDSGMRLFNPVTRVCINLPPLEYIIAYGSFSGIEKAIVFTIHCKVITLIILGHQGSSLAFCGLGDGYWVKIKFPTPVYLSDVSCINNQIFAVTMTGELMLVDLNVSHGPTALFAASPPEEERGWSNLYLTELGNELMLLFHYKGGQSGLRFNLYKLDDVTSGGKWTIVDDLGENVLLVDECRCVSVSANSFFKSNCIYLVNDNSVSTLDALWKQTWLTVYNIKDKTCEALLISNVSQIFTCPMWFIPTVW